MTPIVRLATQGDGVTADGCHIPFAAPGDRIAPDGQLVPGPHRQAPPCRHFPACGGCQLQHVDDAAYAQYLVDRIAAALDAQRVPLPEFAPPQLSPPNTRRRATLRGERRGNRVAIGFNEHKSNRVIDMRECHVILPELLALVDPLRALLMTLLPEGGRATVTMTRADQGVDLLLAGLQVDDFAANEALTAFATTHALARLSLDEGLGPQLRYQPDVVTITLGDVPVALPEGAFLQATRHGEATLQEAVRDALRQATRVADLFAGLGTFALTLPSARFAVEGSRDAAAALLGTRRVQVAHRNLFRRPLTPDELAPFDGIVLDPPRAGALEQITQLAASKVPTIAYVSCNPATFARDAARLVSGGYRLTRVVPVGQFRWATHVELVGRFVR